MPSSLWDATDDLPSMTLLPDVAKLLSASSYPHAHARMSANPNSDQQLYGGIVPANETEDEDEIDDRPKKKSKSTNNEVQKDGQTKRQRGRPKVSGKDETAAERRRTQIRLAQRAYRNRKENTINELNQKVESLQTVIKAVNSDFARLRETLLNNALVHSSSSIARQIDDLMRQLSDALEPTASDADKTSGDDENEPVPQENHSDEDEYRTRGGHAVPTALQGQTHPANSASVFDFQSSLLGIGADHNMLDSEAQILTNFQSSQALATNFPTSYDYKQGPTLFHEPPTAPVEHLALTSIERFPHKPSYTYSFQETTFARRLHRLCIEKAFQKLMSPNVDHDWVAKTFRFSLSFSNTDRIITAFRNILAKSTDEPLENWRMPYVHIGGAGLHFPRHDANGHPVYPPNLIGPDQAAGPWTLPSTDTNSPGNALEAILENIGFGGEWFDCRDVEEYLKTKGIYPAPQDSFVVVDQALVGLTSVSTAEIVETLTSTSSPQSHESEHASHDPKSSTASVLVPERDALQAQADLLSTIPDIDHDWLAQQNLYGPNTLDADFLQSSYEIAGRETRLLTIEIEKFLDRLVDQSVCLGRAPGFRKDNVDHALVQAMQEAF